MLNKEKIKKQKYLKKNKDRQVKTKEQQKYFSSSDEIQAEELGSDEEIKEND